MTAQRERTGRHRAFITPGFPYSDVTRAGLSVMVNDVRGADRSAGLHAADLAELAWAARNEFDTRAITPAEAVRQARAVSGRVMLADVGDNIGGGSPGDGTTLLTELIAVRDRRSLVVLWDPAAVQAAAAVGVGGAFVAHLGGHVDDRHGPTVHEHVRVRSLSNGRYRPSGEWMGGREFDLGPCAVLTCAAVTILVTSVSTPPFHVEQVTSQGLEVEEFDILTAKGALAWQDGYGPYVQHTVFVDTPGVTPAYPQDLRRRHRFDPEIGGEWVFPARRAEHSGPAHNAKEF
jgi:microcystin degradation protein MlrC